MFPHLLNDQSVSHERIFEKWIWLNLGRMIYAVTAVRVVSQIVSPDEWCSDGLASNRDRPISEQKNAVGIFQSMPAAN